MPGSFAKSSFTSTPLVICRQCLKFIFFVQLDFALDSSGQSVYLELIAQTQVFSLEEGGCCKPLGYPIQGQVETFPKHLLEGGACPALPLLSPRQPLSMSQRASLADPPSLPACQELHTLGTSEMKEIQSFERHFF